MTASFLKPTLLMMRKPFLANLRFCVTSQDPEQNLQVLFSCRREAAASAITWHPKMMSSSWLFSEKS